MLDYKPIRRPTDGVHLRVGVGDGRRILSRRYRKLVSTIYEMLEENSELPSYTPNIEECVASIHDCLRYTMVFPNHKCVQREVSYSTPVCCEDGFIGKGIGMER